MQAHAAQVGTLSVKCRQQALQQTLVRKGWSRSQVQAAGAAADLGAEGLEPPGLSEGEATEPAVQRLHVGLVGTGCCKSSSVDDGGGEKSMKACHRAGQAYT